MSLSLEGASPEAALGGLARANGLQFTLDPNVDGEVTVRLSNVRLKTALDAICDSIGCTWKVEAGQTPRLHVQAIAGGKPSKLPIDEVIDIKITDADAHDFLKTLAMMMGAELDLDPAVTGKVSLTLEKTPLRKGLDALCHAVQCRWSYDSSRKLLKVVRQ